MMPVTIIHNDFTETPHVQSVAVVPRILSLTNVVTSERRKDSERLSDFRKRSTGIPFDSAIKLSFYSIIDEADTHGISHVR